VRGHDALAPFLARGWTAAVVPVATPAETIAALTILSFRPGSPLAEDTIDAGVAIAGQAALAIDNARLYQQQKEFADTMQRSLLPREQPAIPGLEVGEVYESSARVDSSTRASRMPAPRRPDAVRRFEHRGRAHVRSQA